MLSYVANTYTTIFASKYITNKDTIIFAPEYNKKLNIELISNYTELIFSNCALCNELFIKYKNNDLDNLKYLGSKFNQPIPNLPPNLTHLTFGDDFNKSLDYLPNGLRN